MEEKKEPQFLKYESIQPSPSNFMGIFQRYQELENENIYITEKIHGSNMQIIYDPNQNAIKLGKRTSQISNWINLDKIDTNNLDVKQYLTDSFFKQQVSLAIKNYINKIIKLIQVIQETYKDQHIQSIHIYGELFGGIFNGEEGDFKFIQKQIYYSKNFHFWAFDIAINEKMLNPDQFQDIIQKLDFVISAPLIKKLKFSDLFDTKTVEFKYQYKDFQTLVPNVLKEEEFKKEFEEQGSAEGIVMKFKDVIWKIKSEKFFEVINQAVPNQQKRQKKKQPQKIYEDPTQYILERITFHRIQNVMIKEGNNAEFKIAVEKMREDIEKDLKQEQIENYDQNEFSNYFKKVQDIFNERVQKIYTNYMKQFK